MGKLERQIMIGALALVGILVAVVILKGLAPRGDGGLDAGGTPLMLEGTAGATGDAGGEPAVEPPATLEPWLSPEAFGGVVPQAPVLDSVVPGPEMPVSDGSTPIPLDPAAVSAAPVVPVAPAVVDNSPREYKIREGDTLSEISQRELGTVRRMKEIEELNPELKRDALVPGTVIKLPARGAAKPAEAAPAPAADDGQYRTHQVVAGDSLWALAQQYLGDGNRFREIVAANSAVLKSENSVLPLGAKLRIPRK